jgi:hypothetical protein
MRYIMTLSKVSTLSIVVAAILSGYCSIHQSEAKGRGTSDLDLPRIAFAKNGLPVDFSTEKNAEQFGLKVSGGRVKGEEFKALFRNIEPCLPRMSVMQKAELIKNVFLAKNAADGNEGFTGRCSLLIESTAESVLNTEASEDIGHLKTVQGVIAHLYYATQVHTTRCNTGSAVEETRELVSSPNKAVVEEIINKLSAIKDEDSKIAHATLQNFNKLLGGHPTLCVYVP